MIRRMEKHDRKDYIMMSKAFYNSDAVLHKVAEKNFNATFDQIMNNNPFVDGFIFEHDEKTAGYALISIAYSNEAGGNVLWLEELYILPEFQSQGLGTDFIGFIEKRYKGKAARVRLEVEKTNLGAIELYKRLGYEKLPYLQMFKEF